MYKLIDTPFTVDDDLLDMEEGDPWGEEQTMLEAIWGLPPDTDADAPETVEPRLSCTSLTVSRVRIEFDKPPPSHVAPFVPEKIYLHVQKPANSYPNSIPVITIVAEGSGARLPAHIRLSIIRQAAQHAFQHLRGEQMVFSIVDWLGENILRIIEHPGRLREVASAITQLEKTPAEKDRPRKAASKPRKSQLHALDWTPGSPLSVQMLAAWTAKLRKPEVQRMLLARKSLPAWNKRPDIVSAVTGAQVTVITGETGSGKSTQSVQFILDDLISRQLGEQANIICTQPRRISALGLADRVADERCTQVGQEVGYVIRGDSRSRRGLTRITFVTTGVLLRKMQMSGVASGEGGDDAEGEWAGLEGVSHVFVDEVHERSLDTDFLLVLLKRALVVRKDLKVILMSATVDAASFADYFSSAGVTVNTVEIEGRTFPVKDQYVQSSRTRDHWY